MKNINYAGNKPIVTTAKGEKIIADHVILTSPIGYLKKQFNTLFTPSLPAIKTKFIENIKVEQIVKLVITYKSPFWKNTSDSLVLAWTNDDFKSLIGDRMWLRSLFGFFFPKSDLPFMHVLFHGPYANLLKTVDDTVLKNEINQIIKKTLGQLFMLSNEEKVTRVDWSRNKNFLGHYSYIGLKVGSSADLAEPLINNNGKATVHFAGDATSEHWYGNIEGELESGFRVADEINQNV